MDRALYVTAARCSFAEIDLQVEAARKTFDPAETERRRLAALEQRQVRVRLREMTHDGLVPITALVDVADAVAFDEALTAKAAELDPAISLDVRRAIALGMLGQDNTTTTNNGSDASGGSGGDAGAGDGRGTGAGETRREVLIYTHARPGDPMVGVENTRSTVTPEQVRDWCQHAGTKVTVRPVIDLNDDLSTESYEPTERLKEQIRLRWPECVFPLCHWPSRSCDLDHIIPWPLGPTASWNLAPLCRGHHRLKTHCEYRGERLLRGAHRSGAVQSGTGIRG